jgi:hypothetical protein
MVPERVRRLREHLIEALREMRAAKPWARSASPTLQEPTPFVARVAETACSLCKGWCCRNGDDDAFLDDETLARVRLARPDMTERALLQLYLDHVPAVAYRDSCIFHGNEGARWIARSGPAFATATTAAVSVLTLRQALPYRQRSSPAKVTRCGPRHFWCHRFSWQRPSRMARSRTSITPVPAAD